MGGGLQNLLSEFDSRHVIHNNAQVVERDTR